jgi:hypothetical protein
MAFKMNRSMMKGSPAYKKAKAEAKSIVAKAPAGPDAGLVSAAELLGKSKRMPKIDFTIKQPKRKIDWGDLEFGKRKPKEPKVKKERKKFKLGEKIGDFFVSKAGQIRDAAGNILSGIDERRAQKEIDNALALERKNEQKLKERLIREQAEYEKEKEKESEIVKAERQKLDERLARAEKGG